MPKKTHNGAHLYERLVTKRDKVIYKCMIPSCPHFISTTELIVNRICKCWNECGRELVITREIYQDKIKKPICDVCKDERKQLRDALTVVPVRED